MDDLIAGNVDIYKELGVASTSTLSEISKAYRKKALQFHPDKNASPEAAERFHYFTLINDILQDPELRLHYDGLLNARSSQEKTNWSDQAEQFKAKLQRAEAKLRSLKSSQKSVNEAELAKLEMEGLKLRYQYQLQQKQRKEYVSYRDIPQIRTLESFPAPKAVEVKWKFKDDAVIGENALSEIFTIFGQVSQSCVGSNDGRYCTGTVTFSAPESAEKATSYNYKSASLWDGTAHRKLASLLRSCRLVYGLSDSDIDSMVNKQIY